MFSIVLSDQTCRNVSSYSHFQTLVTLQMILKLVILMVSSQFHANIVNFYHLIQQPQKKLSEKDLRNE